MSRSIGALAVALDHACRDFSQTPALADAQTRLDYAQLADRAHAVAALLQGAGLQADEPVHVAVSNHRLDFAALFGVWLAGGVAVPIHRSTPTAVAQVLQQRTQARLLVDLHDGASAAIAIGGFAPAPRALLAGAALIVFTSGSTGVPKGVVIAHDAFHAKLRQIDALLGFHAGEATLLVLNITFSFGIWVGLLTLLRGGLLVLQPKFEPQSFVQTAIDARIVRAGMVPTMMRVLFSDSVHEAALDRLNRQRTLRQILIGGESLGGSLASAIRARFSNAALIDIYGSTETATCDFFSFPDDRSNAPGSIGRPSPNVQHRIVSGAYGEPVVPGATGELQLRSPYRMAGYLDEPELTAAAYQDGWFRTGDLARALHDGRVVLMGRQKDVISRGGNKVTPAEIEQAVGAHPDIAAALAVGLDDALLGQRIAVLLVARAGARLDLTALRTEIGSRLEKFKLPDCFYQADALPLGRTGKADRMQLKALIESNALVPLEL